jgi:hypothetical protein
MSKIAITLAATCVLFTGCATYEWQHAEKDASQADAALLACEEKALKLYPTLITKDVTAGRAKGGDAVCAAAKKGSNSAAQCVATGGKARGASTYSRDINRNDRNRVKTSCMRAAGWRQVEVK